MTCELPSSGLRANARSGPIISENGPCIASKPLKTSRLNRTRGSSTAAPLLVWSGRCSMAPGVCTGRSQMLCFAASSTKRRTSSCMSSDLLNLARAAPTVAVLSMSIRKVWPRRRAPHLSTNRYTPNNSLKLIGRRFSAPVKRQTISSRAPSIHASSPQA